MVGSIERQLRRIVKSPMMPMMIIVVGVNAPDPNRRDAGYGGVLPVPGPTSVSTTVAIDPMLNAQHREARIQRGRVLYASDHAPAATTPKSPRSAGRAPCPQQRVVQGRSTTASPNT